LRDLTRLAGADPSLWQEIATANAGPVAEGLRSVAATLSGVADALAGPPGSGGPAVRALIEDGRAGRARLGGKHGTAQRHWAAVRVSIEDRPGALVDVLLACRDLAVNVEDLSVEHAQGHPVGILELLVDPSAAGGLAAALGRRGWDVAGVSLPHD
jgi:prephenate dehydrogenase